VSVVEILRATNALEDLPRIAAALGAQPVWMEVPAERWLGGVLAPGGIGRVAMVGQTAGFAWFGAEAERQSDAAEAIARRLAARGEAAGVLALGLRSRALAVAVAYGEVPVLELSLDRPDQLTLACLARIRRPAQACGLPQAAQVAEAISGEGITRRFFRQFRRILEETAAALPGTLGGSDRHGVALLQLTRVLFLYFIQVKGWLNGETDFLRRRVDQCLDQGGSIQRDLLRPLFFGTLNRRLESRGRAARFGRIPFLNGGLFEPHRLERSCRGDLPNSVWCAAFDDLFERFHFTVNEAGPPGAVAPDMLGRVFEGVMAPDQRRATGTFYTPTALVGDLVDAGLVALIGSRLELSDGEAAIQLRAGGVRVQRILRDITVLDPAVGSGGFLLTALERLAFLRAPNRVPGAALRPDILRRNLFGVDLNPMAVRLTELRLWLAVIAQDQEDRPEYVLPLPNLDCLVRQGDTLSDPVGLAVAVSLQPARAGMLIAAIRQGFIIATGEEKRAAARRLRRAEEDAARECLEQAEERVELAISDCLGAARTPDLFGAPGGLDGRGRHRLRELRALLHRIRQGRRRLAQDGEVPWFQFESHFADVFASRGGFDLVVGNPPWVRGERLPPPVRQWLSRRYRWWRVPGSGFGFTHYPDLSVAFLERGFELTAPRGAIAMLVPAKLATAGYATPARHVLGASATLHAVANLTGAPSARFEATTYPLALVMSKRGASPRSMVRDRLDPVAPATVPQDTLLDGAPWVLTHASIRDVLASLRARYPLLRLRYTIHLGVKTGANRVFLNPQNPIEPSLLRWAIRGRDLRAFSTLLRARIVWTHDASGLPYPSLPSQAARHFAANEAILRARVDYTGGPLWTMFRTSPLRAPGRAVWADLARTLTAIALTGDPAHDPIPLNTCYVVPTRTPEEALRLAAWLNATWLRAAARLTAVPASNGYVRFTARTVGALPLPEGVANDPELVALALDAAAGDPIQERLDDVCAAHLALTTGERDALASVAGDGSHHRR